jgi:hypothetical protein
MCALAPVPNWSLFVNQRKSIDCPFARGVARVINTERDVMVGLGRFAPEPPPTEAAVSDVPTIPNCVAPAPFGL